MSDSGRQRVAVSSTRERTVHYRYSCGLLAKVMPNTCRNFFHFICSVSICFPRQSGTSNLVTRGSATGTLYSIRISNCLLRSGRSKLIEHRRDRQQWPRSVPSWQFSQWSAVSRLAHLANCRYVFIFYPHAVISRKQKAPEKNR